MNKLDFTTDMDIQVTDDFRFVQLTGEGSGCSIHLSTDSSIMKPGSQQGAIMVVDNAEAAKEYFEGKGVVMSDIDELDFGKHIHFKDPDGNGWTIQESHAQNKNKA